MGGSSLGPEVLATTFGHKSGFPRLRILDSTVPAQIKALEGTLDLGKTLFIVSSKSGTTTEPNVFKDYFFKRVADTVGEAKAGRHFVAITDPGSALEKTAKAQNFRKIFFGVPSIGGRYSVLSPFGLVPAAVAGIDVARLMKSARMMMHSCGPDVPPAQNPGVELGLALGAAALRGRDKVTILASPRSRPISAPGPSSCSPSRPARTARVSIPIDGEPLGVPQVYGDDRFFIALTLDGEPMRQHDAKLKALESAGHPVVRIGQASHEQYRPGIFPLRDRDRRGRRGHRHQSVRSAGRRGQQSQDARADRGVREERRAAGRDAGVFKQIHRALHRRAQRPGAAAAGANFELDSWLTAHLGRVHAGDYFALLAYIARDDANAAPLQRARLAMRDRRHVATCLEFGPRFLHSTGQAYKGGPDSGVFLQITADDAEDVAIPGATRQLRRGQGGAGARRFRRAGGARPPRAARAYQRRFAAGLAELEAAVKRALA